MKSWKKILPVVVLLLVTVVLCAGLLCACGSETVIGGVIGGTQQDGVYTVTYVANGGVFEDGAATMTETVAKNARLTAPVAPVREGYTFAGWAKSPDGNGTWDFASDSVAGETELRAQWTAKDYTLTVVATDGGTITGAQTGEYTYDSTVTLSAEITGDYHFLGWFDGDGEKLSGDLTYDYSMRLDTTVTAKFEKHDFSLTGTTATCTAAGTETYECTQCHITKQEEAAAYDHDWSLTSTTATCTAAGTGTYECTRCHATKQGATEAYGHDFLLTGSTATCTAAGTGTYECTHCHETKQEAVKALGHSGFNQTCTRCGNAIGSYIRCDKDNTPSTNGKYILFGEYPQTIKDDSVTITETTDSRGYYLGSDGYYYAKVTATPYGSNCKFTTGSAVTKGTVYYFKVEPIRWRILTDEGGRAFLLCDSVIANRCFYETPAKGTGVKRMIDGKAVYANNYEYSSIRKWLNEEFYKNAFSEMQRQLIAETTVDNSARSTNPNVDTLQFNNGNNSYACANTNDKVFLLSEREATNSAYGFASDHTEKDTARRMKASDYARATGVSINTSTRNYGNARWWLRSSHYYSGDDVCNITNEGSANDRYSVERTESGCVPALWISL